jgi:hypothetical protein
LKSEKDVRVTKPIKIDHPTELILLPFIKRADEQIDGEQW